MSANSVLAPHEGMMRPESSEYLAGAGRKELSECHSRSPSLKNQTRSSADMILPWRSRLEKSAMPGPSRWSSRLRMWPGLLYCSSSPKLSVKGDLLLVREVLVVEDEHGIRIHPSFDRRHVGAVD